MIGEIIMTMYIPYDEYITNLLKIVPDIYAVAIVEGRNEIIYSTDNWDISNEIDTVSSSWNSQSASHIIISGVKYMMLQCDIDTMVATSIRGEGHIVAAKDEKRKIITYVVPDGDRKAAIVEISRVLQAMNAKTPYKPEDSQFDSNPMVIREESIPTIDPQLEGEIKEFLGWMSIPDGLPGFIEYHLQQNNIQMISELSKIYSELRRIIGA